MAFMLPDRPTLDFARHRRAFHGWARKSVVGGEPIDGRRQE